MAPKSNHLIVLWKILEVINERWEHLRNGLQSSLYNKENRMPEEKLKCKILGI